MVTGNTFEEFASHFGFDFGSQFGYTIPSTIIYLETMNRDKTISKQKHRLSDNNLIAADMTKDALYQVGQSPMPARIAIVMSAYSNQKQKEIHLINKAWIAEFGEEEIKC